MSITNYGELKTAIASYANRSDLTSSIPDFVTLSETIFNYGHGKPEDPYFIPPLRTRDMEVGPTSISVASNLVPLPSDFLEAISVDTDASPSVNLTYKDPNWYSAFYPNGDSTLPVYYTVKGGNILVTANIKLTYYQKISTVTTADATTNWLLTKSPGVYLHAGLFNLYVFMQDQDKAVSHRTLLLSYMAGLAQTDMFSRAGVFVRTSSMPSAG